VDIGAAPGTTPDAVHDQLVAGEHDADKLRLGSRLPAAHAAALGI
jgi:hypothetical protein